MCTGEEFADALSHICSSEDAAGNATPERGVGDKEHVEDEFVEEKWADDDPAWAPRLNRMFRM